MTETEWLSNIYSTVDDVCASDRALPPGAFNKLARLTDSARYNPASRDYVKRAEDMLIMMHRLRSALRDYAGQSGVRELKIKLGAMRDDWIRSLTIC